MRLRQELSPPDLSDDELGVLMTLAAPIERARRDAFLERCASALASRPARGPGAAHRVGRELQRSFYAPPQMSDAGERSRTPRQGYAYPSTRRS
jgi:hypothetical protein